MVERRVIEVDGVVQGVGFRPYVHRLAASNGLGGFVRNDTAGVHIDIQGEPARVDEFCRLLTLEPPALSTIGSVRMHSAPPGAYVDFHIASSDPSRVEGAGAVASPDAAPCAACLRELFDPADRREGYPFISCTDCGPRFTIVTDTPFDRERTTMAMFPLCRQCQTEYHDAQSRRFHAESLACPDCGPVLSATGADSREPCGTGREALAAAVSILRAGGIVAIKALGGFHLACDATSESAVDTLRSRKHRPTKPFAVMVKDADAAADLCRVSHVEAEALVCSGRPVVLLERREHAPVVASVSPQSRTLGVMLPSTPLHHLLLAALDRPLVMTSGNRSGEPVAIDEQGAFAALRGVADLFLAHDRPIAARCDDSVVRVIAGAARPLRRARGFVPRAIALPSRTDALVLAFGGHLKNTVCLAHDTAAHLSAHVGDLESIGARDAVDSAIGGLLRTTRVRPEVVAHDLHPEYASTHMAESWAERHGIPHRVPVQHHHAHVAACVAEYGVDEPVIGVVFDGAGLGTDGAIWGGEFLLVDGARFRRCGHLGYVPLPGGDAAARRPWAVAASHLAHANASVAELDALRPGNVDEAEWGLVQQLIARRQTTPRTSSVGRLFDAVASLIGLRHVSNHEGEAAMALEDLAGARVESRYEIALDHEECWAADPARIVEGVVADLRRRRQPSDIAAAFHGAMRDLIVSGCDRIRDETGLATVVLSGGVFVNALLSGAAHEALTARGFQVLLPRLAPCNDGGLSLGQAWVAVCASREDLCA